jgi:hypothetical protein
MMKKIGLVVLLVGILSSVFAGPAAAPSVYGNFYLQSVTSGNIADTVKATDSVRVFHLLQVPPAADYVFTRNAITGNGSDSVALQVVIDSYDAGKNLIGRTVVDTLLTAAGEALAVPLNASIVGSFFSMKLIGLATNGGDVIVNRWALYARKLYKESKPYTGR